MAFVLPVTATELVFFARCWEEAQPGKRNYLAEGWMALLPLGKTSYWFDDAGNCSEVDWEDPKFDDDDFFDVDDSDRPSYRELDYQAALQRSDDESRTIATAEVMASLATDLCSGAVKAQCLMLTVPPFCHPGSIEAMHKMCSKFGKTALFEHGPWVRSVKRPWVVPDEVVECREQAFGFVESTRICLRAYEFDSDGNAVQSYAYPVMRVGYDAVVNEQLDKADANDRDLSGMRERALAMIKFELLRAERDYTGPTKAIVRLPPGCSREQILDLMNSTRFELLFSQGEWIRRCDGPAGLRQFADCPY